MFLVSARRTRYHSWRAHIIKSFSPLLLFGEFDSYMPSAFTHHHIRGLIGPTRQFGVGSIYHPHLYCIIVGVFIPIPFYLWQRRYPKSWVRYVNTPVVFSGLSAIPPATGINYSSWFFVAFIFQYLIRKKNFAWWSKFNYVLSSALDSGTVISVMVIFFTLQVGFLDWARRIGFEWPFLVPKRWDTSSKLVG